MMIYCVFIFLMTIQVFAGEIGKTPLANQATVSMPQNLGNCQPASQAEEKMARKWAEENGLSKEEILARLIYSEALSTGYWKNKCNAESDVAIMKSIGWGVMNRVQSKAKQNLDAYSDVIFAKNQFRTSFSGKKENPFATSFLCPLQADSYLKSSDRKIRALALFSKTREVAENIVREYEKTGIPKKYQGITNFFYPESEFFGELRPAWAPHKEFFKNSGYIDTVGASTKPCVETYKLK